jgi:hypothetical protein
MSVRIFLALLLLCLLTGLFLDSLGISARGMLHDAGHTILLVGRLLERAVSWAVPYVLLGAVVVLPAAVVLWALRRAWRG